MQDPCEEATPCCKNPPLASMTCNSTYSAFPSVWRGDFGWWLPCWVGIAAQVIDGLYSDSLEMDSPGAPMLLVVWIAALFLSILIHELGHSLAMRYYGLESRIVLYHFGGLAIPDSFGRWSGARAPRIGAREQIVISAAGPFVQLLFGLAVWCLGLVWGIHMLETDDFNRLFGAQFGADATYPGSAVVFMAFHAFIWPSVYWAILNLAPILPLDGGQIMRGTLMLTRVDQPVRMAHMVSAVAGGLIGVWFLTSQQPFAGIMFLMFAANNWQAMQSGIGSY